MLESISRIIEQLGGALASSDDGPEPQQRVVVVLTRRIKLDTWRAVSLGDVQRPTAWLAKVRPLARRAQRSAHEGSATVLVQLVDDLRLAESALPRSGPATRLEDLKTDTQRSILRTLRRRRDRLLVRSEITSGMPQEHQVTPQAISKALRRLADLGLVRSELQVRQGARHAQVWGLTPSGTQLADRLHRERHARPASGVAAQACGFVIEMPRDHAALHAVARRYAATQGPVLILDYSDWCRANDSKTTELLRAWRDAPTSHQGLGELLRERKSTFVPGDELLPQTQDPHEHEPLLQRLTETLATYKVALWIWATPDRGADMAIRTCGHSVFAAKTPRALAQALHSGVHGAHQPLFIHTSSRPARAKEEDWRLATTTQWTWQTPLVRLGLGTTSDWQIPRADLRDLDEQGAWRCAPASSRLPFRWLDLLCWELARRCGEPHATDHDEHPVMLRFREQARDLARSQDREWALQAAGRLATADRPEVVRSLRRALEREFTDPANTELGCAALAEAALSVLAKQAGPAAEGLRRLTPAPKV